MAITDLQSSRIRKIVRKTCLQSTISLYSTSWPIIVNELTITILNITARPVTILNITASSILLENLSNRTAVLICKRSAVRMIRDDWFVHAIWLTRSSIALQESINISIMQLPVDAGIRIGSCNIWIAINRRHCASIRFGAFAQFPRRDACGFDRKRTHTQKKLCSYHVNVALHVLRLASAEHVTGMIQKICYFVSPTHPTRPNCPTVCRYLCVRLGDNVQMAATECDVMDMCVRLARW